jgi:hypothetical protein
VDGGEPATVDIDDPVSSAARTVATGDRRWAPLGAATLLLTLAWMSSGWTAAASRIDVSAVGSRSAARGRAS